MFEEEIKNKPHFFILLFSFVKTTLSHNEIICVNFINMKLRALDIIEIY